MSDWHLLKIRLSFQILANYTKADTQMDKSIFEEEVKCQKLEITIR